MQIERSHGSPAGAAPPCSTGQASAQDPQLRHRSALIISTGAASMPSGLWHQVHERGHPFKKTVVRIPGPSCTEQRWILKTSPVSLDSVENANSVIRLNS